MDHFYVQYGELFNGYSNVPMKNPAVLIDREDDILLKVGEYDKLVGLEAHFAMGARIMGKDDSIMTISLASLSKEEACYVIRRMQEFTASGFVKKFGEKIFDADVKEWLSSEMGRIPLATTNKEQEVER